MKNNFLKTGTLVLVVMVLLAGCTKDLNRYPSNTTTASQVYSTAAGYKEALAKVYGSFALTSSTGPGNSDLGGIDAGTSDFVRLLFDAQELSTDEAVCAWNDPGVPDFHNMNWNQGNVDFAGIIQPFYFPDYGSEFFYGECE